MFIQFNNNIRNVNSIWQVDCNSYMKSGSVCVYFTDGTKEYVQGAEATNVIMALCPSVLEGKEVEYAKHAWAIHNLIGHPLMQIFSWFGLTRLGIKIHDATAPAPFSPKPIPIE